MTGVQKTIAWVIVGVIGAVLIITSAPETSRPAGHKGSYLGRQVADSQLPAQQVQELNSRAGTVQRF